MTCSHYNLVLFNFQIESNVFANSSKSSLVLREFEDAKISVKNNTFSKNIYALGCACVFVSYNQRQNEAKLTMELNAFYQNLGTTIVQVTLYDDGQSSLLIGHCGPKLTIPVIIMVFVTD